MSEQVINNLCKKGYRFDENGIFVAEDIQDLETVKSKKVWEKIYDFDIDALEKDRRDFFLSKIDDHMEHIGKSFVFKPDSICLEIGSGPAYIGEYIMKEFDSFYIGIDFNYGILLSVKRYFDKKGFSKYLLIHGDIRDIPLKDGSIDFIYGGGVIEHPMDTDVVLGELHRVLKTSGVSFNTVPCLNLSWFILRPMANIPSTPIILRKLFEYIHIKILKNKILDRFYGYELSFTKNSLRRLHERNGFKNIVIGSFTCHSAMRKLKNPFLRRLYFNIQKPSLTSFFHYVFATK